MAMFLHRLCLFALLATTGFALSNCHARMEEQAAILVPEASEHPAPAEETVVPKTPEPPQP